MIQVYRRLACDPTLECLEEIVRTRSRQARLTSSAGEKFFAKQFDPGSDAAQNSGGMAHLRSLILNDLAGLLFLSEIPETRSIVPTLVGGDREHCAFLMKDIGNGEQLDELLRGEDEMRASEGLCALMTSLAVMHGATIGRAERYRSIRRELGDFWDDEDEASASLGDYLTFIEKISSRLKIGTPSEVASEVRLVLEEMFRPSPLYGYCHRDPCPDNCRLVDNQMKVYDFEMSGFANVLYDAVYPVVRFPTCWCVGEIPENIVQRAEAAYRETLARWVPSITDDEYYRRGKALAVGYWMMRTAKWQLEQAFDEDRSWGLATVRERFRTRWKIATRLMREEEILPGLSVWFEDVFEAAESLWDPSALALYPAFRRS